MFVRTFYLCVYIVYISSEGSGETVRLCRLVGRLFLAVPRGCLQFVIVVFPDHTHLLFLSES